MIKLKALLERRHRDEVKDKIELAFAVITIVSYVINKVQEKKSDELEEDCQEAKPSSDPDPVYNISSL
jgi:hypothetical protein